MRASPRRQSQGEAGFLGGHGDRVEGAVPTVELGEGFGEDGDETALVHLGGETRTEWLPWIR